MTISPIPLLAELVPRAQSHEIFACSLENGTQSHVAFTASNPRNFNYHGSGNLSQSRGENSSHRGGRTNGCGGGQGNGRGCGGGRGRGGYIPHCQLCKIEGHKADRCPNLPNHSSHLADAFNASFSLNANDSADWYIDSGSSAHMTSNSSHLHHTETYSEPSDKKSNSSRAS